MPKTTKSKPTTRRRASKPVKGFPLFKHQRGYWCKKVAKKLRYFGKVADDPDGKAALALWLAQRDDLLAGRTPRVKAEGLRLCDLVNRFLAFKRGLADNGEITPRTFGEYVATAKRLCDALGRERLVTDLVSDDFGGYRQALAKSSGPHRLANEVQRARSIFKYGFDAGLLDRPVRYGPEFRGPSRKVLRIARAKRGPKLFEARHIRRMLKAASPAMRAMMLLALNGGLGNTDCAALTFDRLDLRGGWLDYPRPKTGVARRVPLWPRTVEALEAAIAKRPEPTDKAHDKLVFITKYRRPWGNHRVDDDGKEIVDSAITKEFRKLLAADGLHRPGLGFYTLRHVFRTVADGSRDRTACDSIMGHVDATMAGAYIERVDDDRLRAVVDHVHRWLFRAPDGTPRKAKSGARTAGKKSG